MNKNQETANRLNKMTLSDRAIVVISGTDLDVLDEIFGHCQTAAQVEEIVNEYFMEE